MQERQVSVAVVILKKAGMIYYKAFIGNVDASFVSRLRRHETTGDFYLCLNLAVEKYAGSDNNGWANDLFSV